MHQVIEVLGKQISFIWEDPWVDVTILKIRKPTQQAIEAIEESLKKGVRKLIAWEGVNWNCIYPCIDYY